MFFIIADTHMGHKNICKYCNRPIGFEKLVLKNWKEKVNINDVVIHLGDLSFEEGWVKKMGTLSGKKILLRGNHDRLTNEKYLDAGWMIMESMVLKIQGMHIIFSHRPILGHRYDINIHGHQHDLHVLDDSRLYFPVALEHSKYAPVAMDENFLTTLKSFVDRQKQPKQETIRAMLGSDRELENRDLYGGFGKESFEASKERLKKGMEILRQHEITMTNREYIRLNLLREFVEGKMTLADFRGKIFKAGEKN